MELGPTSVQCACKCRDSYNAKSHRKHALESCCYLLPSPLSPGQQDGVHTMHWARRGLVCAGMSRRLTSTVLKPETTKLIAMDSLFRPAQVDAGQEQHSRVSRFLSCSRSLHGRIPAISATHSSRTMWRAAGGCRQRVPVLPDSIQIGSASHCCNRKETSLPEVSAGLSPICEELRMLITLQ